MIKVFGLKNCDSCRNALKWLKDSDLIHEFHDVRGNEVDADAISRWVFAVGWKFLLNTRSTTWRGLPNEKKTNVSEEAAMKLMLENPTLIKRPVFEAGDQVIVGFIVSQKAALEKQR